jgi:hypothetical protein
MYSDEDLNLAIEKKIFTSESVNEFRKTISEINNTSLEDQESFQLIGGFSDIFVVIACGLLLFSLIFILRPINENFALFSFVSLSWALSEFFVLKRRMSLPAIVLLIAFVGGVFLLCSSLFAKSSELTIMTGAAASTVAAYFHWLRFKVPVTIAAGTVALISLIISTVSTVFPNIKDWILILVFICGVGAFVLAMYWDSRDFSRVTRKSDVAFWLHLVSAPLIIHPLFSSLGVLDGNQHMFNMAGVIILYALMTLVSVAIDRRAFMISSLAYVLYAFSSILKDYGDVGYSFALTGVFMGAVLLLLSAFWHLARSHIVSMLPLQIRRFLPKIMT